MESERTFKNEIEQIREFCGMQVKENGDDCIRSILEIVFQRGAIDALMEGMNHE
jgi:hypothetical protein